jgi:hypothetical protein
MDSTSSDEPVSESGVDKPLTGHLDLRWHFLLDAKPRLAYSVMRWMSPTSMLTTRLVSPIFSMYSSNDNGREPQRTSTSGQSFLQVAKARLCWYGRETSRIEHTSTPSPADIGSDARVMASQPAFPDEDAGQPMVSDLLRRLEFGVEQGVKRGLDAVPVRRVRGVRHVSRCATPSRRMGNGTAERTSAGYGLD